MFHILQPLARRLFWEAHTDHAERGRIARQALEPIHCCISLCLLSVYPDGSKVSIRDHGLLVQRAGVLQAYDRTRHGDSFEDLTMLRQPVQAYAKQYIQSSGKRRECMQQIMLLARRGLQRLVVTYQDMAQRDTRYLSKARAVRDLVELYRGYLTDTAQNALTGPGALPSEAISLDSRFNDLWSDDELEEVCMLFKLSNASNCKERAAALLNPVQMLLDSKLSEIDHIITRYQRGEEV